MSFFGEQVEPNSIERSPKLVEPPLCGPGMLLGPEPDSRCSFGALWLIRPVFDPHGRWFLLYIELTFEQWSGLLDTALRGTMWVETPPRPGGTAAWGVKRVYKELAS